MLKLRTDRMASVYFFHPLRQRYTRGGQSGVPILMYHSISERNGKRSHPYYETETSGRIFEQHLRFLQKNNFSILPLGEAVKRAESGERSTSREVVITFDDGYRDFYTRAFPLLQEYGGTATVYLPSASIGDTAREFRGKQCLTWAEVRELHRAGIEFGSHSVSHPQLQFVSPEALDSEVRCSKETIENQLGGTVHSFSYPFAFPEVDSEFKKRLRGLLVKYGYENGVSTILGTAGPADDRFFLKRLPINSWDDRQLFKAKLEGGYDWLHGVQYIVKVVKSQVE